MMLCLVLSVATIALAAAGEGPIGHTDQAAAIDRLNRRDVDIVVVVPKDAVLTGAPGTQPMVIGIDPTGLVHRLPVKIGLQNDQKVEILGGIDDGQLVATSSLSDLNDGDIVAPQVQTRTAGIMR